MLLTAWFSITGHVIIAPNPHAINPLLQATWVAATATGRDQQGDEYRVVCSQLIQPATASEKNMESKNGCAR